MKLTKERLKKMITETLNEVYKLSPEDKIRRTKLRLDPNDPNKRSFDADLRRSFGLQDQSEIEKERYMLKYYQQQLRSTEEGKELIKSFMSGKGVTVVHSIGFESWADEIEGKVSESSNTPFTDWLSKFGNQNKNTLSTVASRSANAWFNPYDTGEDPQTQKIWEDIGFYMKGYPVYISRGNVMSQNLSHLPDGLKKHQQSSGIAKRTGDIGHAVTKLSKTYGDQHTEATTALTAGEVLLDNWEPIGVRFPIVGVGKKFVTKETVTTGNENGVPLDLKGIREMFEDAFSTGLPVIIVDPDYGGRPVSPSEKDLEFMRFITRLMLIARVYPWVGNEEEWERLSKIARESTKNKSNNYT